MENIIVEFKKLEKEKSLQLEKLEQLTIEFLSGSRVPLNLLRNGAQCRVPLKTTRNRH